MKKLFKNSLFTFILGAIIFGTTSAIAATLLASNVSYDNTNSGLKDSSNQDITNVNDAIDALYSKINNNTSNSLSSNYDAWPIWLNILNEKSIEIPASSSQNSNMLAINTNSDGSSLAGAFNDSYLSGSYNWVNAWMPLPSTGDEYIGYNFNKPVMIYKMTLNYSSYENSGNYSFVLEGKKEDGTWESIGEEYLINASSSFRTINYNINNTNFYNSYRIKNSYSTTGNGKQYWHVKGQTALSIGELKFYCVE